MGDRRGTYRVLVGNLRKGDYFKDRGVDGMIILKWIFEKLDEGHGVDWCGSG
jgi:hypothetical protein